jgi:hypothetical protein
MNQLHYFNDYYWFTQPSVSLFSFFFFSISVGSAVTYQILLSEISRLYIRVATHTIYIGDYEMLHLEAFDNKGSYVVSLFCISVISSLQSNELNIICLADYWPLTL